MSVNLSNLRQQLNEKDQQLKELFEKLRVAEDDRQIRINEFSKLEMKCRNVEMEYQKVKNRYDYSQSQLDKESENHERILEFKEKEITSLKQRVLQILEQNNLNEEPDENRELVINLEKKNQQQNEYISKLEIQLREMESKIKQLDQSHLKIQEQRDEIEQIKNNFQRQAKKMNDILQAKDRDIDEKRNRIKDLETRLLEQGNEQQDDLGLDHTEQFKYKELKQKNKKMKEDYEVKIQELELSLQETKLQLRSSTRPLNIKDSQHSSDSEIELAKLSIENEQLHRKIKDLLAKQQKLEQNTDSLKVYKKLELDYQAAKDELIQAKMQKVSFDKKADDHRILSQQMEKKYKELENDFQAMQKDLIKTKSKYGDALNICLEQVGPELVDKIMQGSDKY